MSSQTKIGFTLGLFLGIAIIARIIIPLSIDDQGFLVNLSSEIIGAMIIRHLSLRKNYLMRPEVFYYALI